MADVLRLGIAGLGLGSARVLPEIAKLPFLALTAAADIRRAGLDRFRQDFGGEVYTDVGAMVRSPNVDAVYVATPNHLHAEHAITALDARKHVIVEKPMALSISECEAMNAAAERNGVQLLSGHTHSLDAAIEKMAALVRGGELGRPLMINTSFYKNFMFRPFSDEQLAASHGVVLDQGPHQIDIVRLLGGGLVRSVRATAAIGHRGRPAEGHFVCYLEFESGLPAMLIFSGYAYLDSAELVWGIGEGGTPADPESFVAAHRFWRELEGPDRDRRVAELIDSWRYGGEHGGEWFFQGRSKAPPPGERHQPFFGVTIVSCERGDVRQSPDGLFVYTAEGRREIPVPQKATGRAAEMRELFDAVNGRPPVHDGRWGMASLEVALAILESANTRREVRLSHQMDAV